MHEIVSVISDNLTIKIILAALWTAISFFAGAYVGHRFNLFRDKRKEFNSAASPIRKILFDQLKQINSNEVPNSSVKDVHFWEFRDSLPVRKRVKADVLWGKYQEEDKKSRIYDIDPGGKAIFHFENKEKYKVIIEKFIAFSELK
ncbi:hypothetical protein ACK1M2_001729 [Providencia rettgeri]